MNNGSAFHTIRAKLIKPLAMVGLLAVLVFGTWISIRAVQALPSVGEYISTRIWPNINAALVSVTSLFIPNERLLVTSSESIVDSGSPVVISWEHISKQRNGSYTFFYTCIENLKLVSEAGAIVLCDTPLAIDSVSAVTVTPQFDGETTDINVTITFTDDAGDSISGETSINVRGQVARSVAEELVGTSTPPETTPASSTNKLENKTTPRAPETSFLPYNATSSNTSQTTSTTTRAEKTYTLTPQPRTEYGQPDLAIKILAVGIVDRSTGAFNASSTVGWADRAGVKFEIVNIGTRSTGTWRFNAVLPTFPLFIFHSEDQQNLAPGDRIEFTLGFDQIDVSLSPAPIIINADPTNSLNESSKENNIARTSISVTPQPRQ